MLTPERKEEINRNVKMLLNPEQYSMDEFHNSADIMDERKVEWIVGLLAALEEAEGDIITLKQKVEFQKEALETYKDNREAMKEQLAEAQQTIAQQGEIIHGIDRELTKLRLALIAIAGTDIIGSSAITMKAIAQEALREGAKESCSHQNVRNTGDIMVLSDGYEVGIAVCKDCGKEVPEKDEDGEQP
ncbi:hypothetical protein AMQ84_27080 [Paenibacillus riograndensis]|uniref:Uncharacterized protein n=1 Tax=Paenibacillus riograndensis TaxID=483937 RepID=A0A132TJX2_9BACL|nr:hypothetical protein [Paenibacillus riograndensis]KWX71590.1 hypothetical protein AMQ84_27080 [Paenibacillus riograndensis]